MPQQTEEGAPPHPCRRRAPSDVLSLRGVPDLRPELNTGQTEPAAAGALDPHARECPDDREYAPVDFLQVGPDGPISPQ